MKGSPISGGIQPRQEDKGMDNECDTQRKKNKGGKGDSNQMNKIMKYTDTKSIEMG